MRDWIKSLSMTARTGAMKGIAARLGPQKAPLLGALLSASLMGSFAWTATVLFWFFWNHWPGH